MNNSIQISVAIPLFNAVKYIEKSLCSALEQDFQYPYEVLIVDDKGTDGSMDVVRCVLQKHPKSNIVRIVEHQENLGIGETRNTILDNVKGKYLFFLDSDDYITPDCLSSLYEVAEKANADITVGSVTRVDEETKREIRRDQYEDIVIRHDYAGIYLQSIKRRMHVELWNKLFRMDLVKEHQIRFKHKVMEDVIWGFRAKGYAQCVAFVSKITLCYNIREGSIMNTIQNLAQKVNIPKKKGTWDSTFAYGDIVIQMQKIINEEFISVPGIYNYYYYQISDSFKNFMDSEYSDEMIQMFEKSIIGYNSFVPSVWKLRNTGYRLAYLLTKLHGEDYKFTTKVINSVAYISSFAKRLLSKQAH